MKRRETALVTGASTGIGLELARELAASGFALALVALDQDRLAAVATRLRAEYGVPVEDYARDLSQPGAAEALWADLSNAGVSVEVRQQRGHRPLRRISGPVARSAAKECRWSTSSRSCSLRASRSRA